MQSPPQAIETLSPEVDFIQTNFGSSRSAFTIGDNTFVIPFSKKIESPDNTNHMKSLKDPNTTVKLINGSKLTSSQIQEASLLKDQYLNFIYEDVLVYKIQRENYIDLNELVKFREIAHNAGKLYNKSESTPSKKEDKLMLQEMYSSVIKFENMILKLSHSLIISFLILSLPIFLGYPSLVGVVMSVALLLYVKIRKWERNEIYGRKSH